MFEEDEEVDINLVQHQIETLEKELLGARKEINKVMKELGL